MILVLMIRNILFLICHLFSGICSNPWWCIIPNFLRLLKKIIIEYAIIYANCINKSDLIHDKLRIFLNSLLDDFLLWKIYSSCAQRKCTNIALSPRKYVTIIFISLWIIIGLKIQINFISVIHNETWQDFRSFTKTELLWYLNNICFVDVTLNVNENNFIENQFCLYFTYIK